MTRLVEVAVPLPLQDTFTYTLPAEMTETAVLGSRVRVSFGRRKLHGYVVGFPDSTDLETVKAVDELVDDLPLLTPKLVELSRWIADYYACSWGEALSAALPTAMKRKRGPKRGRMHESASDSSLLEIRHGIELNDYQQRSLQKVVESLDAGGFQSFLLHGVTGSGKTEVYLRAIQEALSRKRAAILLIPEIALTPQTADRVRRRLEHEVGILHSGMTRAERHDVVEAAAAGEIQVVLGARSAIFAPFRNLGLIVVDEEHEGSYKQGEKPRYHARSVALMRGRLEGCTVILGSATPSLESYQNAVGGKHRLLQIPERVDRKAMARVQIVDMREEENHAETVAPPLLRALGQRIEAGEQSIILLNRRGHSNYVQCFACGELVRCPHCDISLTYHSHGHRLRCHYCNHECPVPEVCPECQNPCQVFRGHGTQRLEQDLQELLPRARLQRMDMDTTSRKGTHRRILESFAKRQLDILLGTQMVAKGHDFPGVTLVGVVHADAGLSIPDFRAAERTFQLLAQVAGRAGRGERPGDVFIQTYMPEHYSIEFAARQDFEGFYQREAELRQSLGYPPFARLLGLTGLAREPQGLSEAMRQVAEKLRNPGLGQNVQILGPAPSAIPRLRGRYREQILVKGGLQEAQKRALLQVLAQVRKRHRGLDFQVDVDPVNLL